MPPTDTVWTSLIVYGPATSDRYQRLFTNWPNSPCGVWQLPQYRPPVINWLPEVVAVNVPLPAGTSLAQLVAAPFTSVESAP